MRSLTLPLTLAASLLVGTSAFAATSTTTSTDAAKKPAAKVHVASKHVAKKHTAALHVSTSKIKILDTGKLTLANGKTFVLPAKIVVADLKVGDTVKVSYHMKGKERTATTVKVVK
ncbi:DUF1344 domain-containing protein [Jiella sp. MQZ9-1]|uniref:DUF1344 domain-containing protein n=1 Tax=Jiella flava TaxID=2816857 RepID=A0A939JVR7_9HYPH|nr:DUF1344 domain-containing protein [Jiella flava]MBO0661536.1 DUF1344 domain-containing protein [Jiella flava]MCD2470178.1 DUF1344 domain-containing protein [Jiella flava]